MFKSISTHTVHLGLYHCSSHLANSSTCFRGFVIFGGLEFRATFKSVMLYLSLLGSVVV
jgi:hypothetical protein